MRGYQFLENDFFELCKTRNVRPMPMLLYIYYAAFIADFKNLSSFGPTRLPVSI